MLLSEKKVWDIVNGKIPKPKAVEDYPAEEQAALKDTERGGLSKKSENGKRRMRRPFKSSASQ